ncbi:hypothetical protein [Phytomonospora endophytica]|uniref:Uncharacterized protein n=1 Tax=Phytomonospora endophytica TaxID=714109 RepID=A0A841FAA3_9ACTN|nr:hypothetical protein [Phytomonospora endophytica]MBB6034181.1 hypothetical protein [Phytomonospora endophytica]GIG66573.1 hypothetical protein Pen01_28680 [Phytomonospora endophytica]
MHPLARVFQIVLLVAGIFFVIVGYSIFYEDYDQVGTDVTGGWSCSAENEKQVCTTDGLTLTSKTKDEAHINIGAGLALILGSVGVAAGGRRKAEAKPPVGVPPQQPMFPQGPPPQGPPPPPHGAPQQY